MADQTAKTPWKTPAIYPEGRAAEFALAVRAQMLVSDAEVLEYVVEGVHQDGGGYWGQFETLTDAADDFRLYQENKE